MTANPGVTAGAGGNTVVVYHLHNLSSHACRLRGYPGIRLLDRKRHPIFVRVAKGYGMMIRTPARPVVVPAHAGAVFLLEYQDNASAGRAPRTVRFVAILLPGHRRPIISNAATPHESALENVPDESLVAYGPDISVSGFRRHVP